MDKIFVDGMRAFKPSPKAPDFIKANLVLDVNELRDFLNRQSGGQVRVDIKESQKGTFYAEVNTFKPSNGATAGSNQDYDDDIPF